MEVLARLDTIWIWFPGGVLGEGPSRDGVWKEALNG